jgi:hypothetical protein
MPNIVIVLLCLLFAYTVQSITPPTLRVKISEEMADLPIIVPDEARSDVPEGLVGQMS